MYKIGSDRSLAIILTNPLANLLGCLLCLFWLSLPCVVEPARAIRIVIRVSNLARAIHYKDMVGIWIRRILDFDTCSLGVGSEADRVVVANVQARYLQ